MITKHAWIRDQRPFDLGDQPAFASCQAYVAIGVSEEDIEAVRAHRSTDGAARMLGRHVNGIVIEGGWFDTPEQAADGLAQTLREAATVVDLELSRTKATEQ